MKTIYLAKGLVLDNSDHAKIIKDSNDVQSFFATDDEVVLHSSVATSRIDLEVELKDRTFTAFVIVTLPDDEINHQEDRVYKLEGVFDYSPNMDFEMQVDTLEFNGRLKFEQLSSDLQGKIYHTINIYVGEEIEVEPKEID